MGHFAKVVNEIVEQVIVAEPEFFETFIDTSPGKWIQTSYNTINGIHILGGIPLRKNFAGIGYTYDEERDAFIPPKRYNSWILNEDTCQWEPPTSAPEDGNRYNWNEEILSWDLVDNG